MTAHLSEVAPPVRVLVVDDHPAIRAGLSMLVSSEQIEICAEAGGRDEALARAKTCRPDLAIVDLSLDGEDGTPLIAELDACGVRVLVYSVHGDVERIRSALAAGALGYVNKSETRDVLLEGIHEIASGHRFVCSRTALALADRLAGTLFADPVETLSRKERQVFCLLGQGEGTAEIAVAMGISPHTVESYYARIQLKLSVQGMYDLRHHAIEHMRRHAD